MLNKSKKLAALKKTVKASKKGMHMMPNGKMMKDSMMEEKMDMMDGKGGKGKKC